MPRRRDGSKSPDLSKLSFKEAVARLGDYQTRGWRLGLDRMQEFLRRLGVSDKLGAPGGPQFIHVAGTNGKGSVCAYLQSMLFEQGLVVGATYSPFVYDVRERVQIGRSLIPKEDFARLASRLLEVGATLEGTELGGPTEFEMKTAMGFLFWAEQRADWVALEVGLGGRLDATNVVDPACSVIVSIGLDHTAILGDTLELIAREKAGIIKPSRPVIVGEMAEEALVQIAQVAAENGSAMWRYGREVSWRDGTVRTPLGEHRGLSPGIFGHMQGHDLALAVAAMDAVGAVRDEKKLAAGAEKARLPGRFERVAYKCRSFILDGAHNAQAAENLVATMREAGIEGKVALLTGRIEGHEVAPFYRALKAVIGKAYVAKIRFHRAMDPDTVVREAGTALEGAETFNDVKGALEACVSATSKGDTVLVAGSFYLVGEVGGLVKIGTDSR